jgi:asparagine synthase (glutamine-hydrolysing)
MCRIFGHIGQGEVGQLRLGTVVRGLIHGGPDQQDYLSTPSWSLGCCRLTIMDPQGGRQPYALGHGIVAVFNGEIYNHNELRHRLSQRGYSFDDCCDGSLIPALYEEYGLGFVEHLDGMFAVAIIDQRETARLVLAVDHLGIKPLYYHLNTLTGKLFFASEIAAIHAFGEATKDIYLPGVEAYLTTKVVTGEHTMFRDIMVMPPGTMLVAELNKKPMLSTWYTGEVSHTKMHPCFDSAAEELEGIIDAEVASLLRADVPVCTINSGGLDSSLVTALASKRTAPRASFHVSYRGSWPLDEKHYARELANAYGTRHHEIELSPVELCALLPEVVKHLGQPHASPNTLSTYGLFRGIAQAGYRVALSGDGADEMFGGYSRFVDAVNCSAGCFGNYVDALGVGSQKERLMLYSDDYRSYLSEIETTGSLVEQRLVSSGSERLQTLLEFERTTRLPAYHLRRVDHLSMAHAVEVRVPYCQKRILEFARCLPSLFSVQARSVKKILYRAGEKYLPRSILLRPKQPFTLPIEAMMQRKGQPLFDFARETLDGHTIGKHGFFSPKAVQRLLTRHQLRPTKQSSQLLWALMIFTIWEEQRQSMGCLAEALAA